MKIYIDDVIFYDGKARGLDYRAQGVNLTDAIKIKSFASGESIRMKVETHLDTTYEDINNPDTSKTKWHFYIAGEEPDPDNPIEPEEIPQVPKTYDDFTPWFFVLLGASIILFVFITVRERAEAHKRNRNQSFLKSHILDDAAFWCYYSCNNALANMYQEVRL